MIKPQELSRMTTIAVNKVKQDGRSLGEKIEKYLMFRLNESYYGLAALKVKEIVPLQFITRVPRMPGHVKGVINLRGKVVPVVDLRLKFELYQSELMYEACIIVVQVDG